MSQGYQIDNPAGLYYLTLRVIDWVDVFTRKSYRDVVLESFSFCQEKKGLNVFAYVIMSNHLHVIASAEQGNLPDVIRDFKKYTAISILRMIQQEPESRRDWMLKRFEFMAQRHVRNSQYQFWAQHNHAIELLSPQFTKQKLTYIHQNPVRAGWVEKPEDWLYSSARNYSDLPGLLSVTLL